VKVTATSAPTPGTVINRYWAAGALPVGEARQMPPRPRGG
jgi:hypothetical protein